MKTSERFEQLIAFLTSHLPEPVEQLPDDKGGIIFTGGFPGEVVAHLTASSVVVAEYRVVFERRSNPMVGPRRVGALRWRRLPETELMNALGSLIKGAREVRLARYRICATCGQRKPPEWMQDLDECVECAARDGVGHSGTSSIHQS
jgi:hypothetical protein